MLQSVWHLRRTSRIKINLLEFPALIVIHSYLFKSMTMYKCICNTRLHNCKEWKLPYGITLLQYFRVPAFALTYSFQLWFLSQSEFFLHCCLPKLPLCLWSLYLDFQWLRLSGIIFFFRKSIPVFKNWKHHFIECLMRLFYETVVVLFTVYLILFTGVSEMSAYICAAQCSLYLTHFTFFLLFDLLNYPHILLC